MDFNQQNKRILCKFKLFKKYSPKLNFSIVYTYFIRIFAVEI